MTQRFSTIIGSCLFAGCLLACSHAPLPRSVAEAQSVSDSQAAQIAKEHSPQAHAEAEKLRAEAEFLHSEGRMDESSAAGEQALAAYNEAFALAQLGAAQQRLERAGADRAKAQAELKRLDLLQSQIEQDAANYEMQARVVQDSKEVSDVEQISPARRQARRLAAKGFSAEALLLCEGAQLLKRGTETLAENQKKLDRLLVELNHGSVKDDLLPRSTKLRAACLQELTLARRELTARKPQSALSDQLLAGISNAGRYMVYRDDRGIVINLGGPLNDQGELTEETREALQFLGGTAKNYPQFPVILVSHTRRGGESEKAQKMTDLSSAQLKLAGAGQVQTISVGDAQPVLPASLQGAAAKNERLEVIFITPGR